MRVFMFYSPKLQWEPNRFQFALIKGYIPHWVFMATSKGECPDIDELEAYFDSRGCENKKGRKGANHGGTRKENLDKVNGK